MKRLLACAAAAALLIAAGPPSAATAAPKRVVALTPFTANTLAGIGVRPMAIGQTLGGNNRFARALRRVSRLPLSHPNGPNLERLASANPDLVFSSATWRKGHRAMRDLDMRVVEVDPDSVLSIPTEIRRVGGIMGRRRAAAKLAARVRAGVFKATDGIRRRPRVLMVLGVGRTPFAFLPNSWGGDIVRRAGGRLLTEGLTDRQGFARISDEVVLERNPDIIIGVPHGSPDDIPAIARHMKTNPAWKETNAVKRNRVYVSVDNSLLQANTDVGAVIKRVRTRFLKN